ncbi:hypothetical protein K466DRAFT_567800 [Polyporus arcularius HHB13444]|uniref:Uncharacterized protein n=1 Tax=Polyporus arcularius HHB13444 TaxID=1314778 RepID=A0A5C3P2M4_9APHY|nr:hypothetical protein K466DRAFT_567800 [Polyporus arcularius HHB13444]
MPAVNAPRLSDNAAAANTPVREVVFVLATPEDGEIVENATHASTATMGTDAANASPASTTSLPSVIEETPLPATQVAVGFHAYWGTSQSPTTLAIGARRAQRRANAAPYPVTPARNSTRASATPRGVASDTSADLWAQVGSPPLFRTPLPAEASDFDLRPANKDAEGTRTASTAAEAVVDDVELAGKQPSPTVRAPTQSNASKRVWRGSPSTIESRVRGRNKRFRASLPDERELAQDNPSLLANPWALSSDEEGEEERAAACKKGPQATSTPVLRAVSPSGLLHVPSDDEFFLDNANTSGCPPTPHCQQNSSFIERLRRSAEEASRRENPISSRVAIDRASHASPRQSTMGGSSPLPPSSPISIDSPTNSARSRADHEALDLLATNRARLHSLLDQDGLESSRVLKESRSRNGQAARGRDPAVRNAAAPANGNRLGRPEDGSASQVRALSRHQATHRGTQAEQDGRAHYVPLPNTRAALYLQEQIEARAAALVRPSLAPGRAYRANETLSVEEKTSGPHQDARSVESTRSPMSISSLLASPSHGQRMETDRELTTPPRQRKSWMETVLTSSRATSPAPRSPGSPTPIPPYYENAGYAVPNALPTALTAAAPEIDRPMTGDHRATARVHRDDPEALIRGTSQRWMSAIWSDPENTTVLVEVFNLLFSDNIQTNRVIVETLKQATYLISGERNVSIVPPDLDDVHPRRSRDAPRVWAIRGLSPAGEEAMLSRFPWSFRAISFFTYKRTVAPDTWIMSLDGFFDEDTHAIASAVREVLQEDMQWERLITLTRSHPELRHLPGRERAKAILDSIVVRTWRLSNQNVVASVHIRPPTYDIPRWREWATGLRSRTYGNFTNGTGIVRRVANCLGCNSVDHPAYLCPFHDLPGWKGPRAGAGTYSSIVQPALPQNGHAQTQNGTAPTRGAPHARGGYPARGGFRTPARRQTRAAHRQTRN